MRSTRTYLDAVACWIRSPRPESSGDLLEWTTVEVAGRPAWFGFGGSGPPVLFLHGWGLGSRTYRRALRRLTGMGRRVYAPALPGFGGTPGLGPSATFADYAAWVDAFLDSVAVDEPAFVIGHSFGGGVATKLAHDHPERVSYLVLLNSVGGGTWMAGGGGMPVSRRPLADWVTQFGRELLPIVPALQMLRTAAEDVVRNVRIDPWSVLHAGQLARTADLTPELAELGRRDLPVLPLTTHDDGVIPMAAFGALCDAMGRDGVVVPGRHSWLLADPDAFGSVLENVLAVDEHSRAGQASHTVVAEIGRLLERTTVPDEFVAAALREAPTMWASSEPASELAADLALCHPPLGPGEVRAVARRGEDGLIRLTVVAPDRPGLLADTAGVLAGEGISVLTASAVTWSSTGVAMHAVTFEAPDWIDDAGWAHLGERLRTLSGSHPLGRPGPLGEEYDVSVSGDLMNRALVTVTGPDRVGVLWAVTSAFTDLGVSVETSAVRTSAGRVVDAFVVSGLHDPDALVTLMRGTGVPL